MATRRTGYGASERENSMTTTEQLPLVESVQQLLGMAELEDVVYYGMSAVRRGENDPEKTSDSYALFVRHDGVRLEVRCRATVDTDDAQYVVDAASQFSLAEPVNITEVAQQEFVQKVGLLAVWPYIRETISANAAKLRLAPMQVKLLRAEDVHITATPPE